MTEISEQIWENFGAVIQGFMILIGVLPVAGTSVAILSVDGVIRLFPMIIFIIAAISVVYAVKMLKKWILVRMISFFA